MKRPNAAIAAGVLAVVAALLLTADPGVLVGRSLLGNGTPDVWGHTWGYWWAADSLSHGRFPLHDAPVAFPRGQTRWIVDAPVAVLLAPLTWLMGPIATYHATALGLLGLGAGSMTWWLRRHDVSTALAIVTGLLVALSPFSRGTLANATPESLAILTVPLLAGLLDDGLAGDRRRLATATALGAFICLMGPYPALSGALVGALVVVHRLRSGPRWQVLGRAVGVALVCGALFALSGASLQATKQPEALAAVNPLEEEAENAWVVAAVAGTDVLNLFTPKAWLPDSAPWILHRHTTYLGYTVLVPALLATWRHRQPRVLLGLAVLCLVLSLGTRPLAAGKALAAVTLPGDALIHMGALSIYRLAGLASLCLLASAALWLRGRRWWPAWAVAVLVEGMIASPLEVRVPTVANPAGPLEAWLAEGPPGAVLDLPLDRATDRRAGPYPQRTFFLQTMHGRPVASGLQSTAPILTFLPTLAELDQALRGSCRRSPDCAHPRPPGYKPATRTPDHSITIGHFDSSQLEQDRQRLAELGFACVTLDLDQVAPPLRRNLERLLVDWLGEPGFSEGDERGWLVDPSP